MEPRSRSYAQMEQAFRQYPPNARVTTHMVLHGNADQIAVELDELTSAAIVHDVLVSTSFSYDHASAIVALNGYPPELCALVTAMARNVRVADRAR